VQHGKVVSTGYNSVRTDMDPTAQRGNCSNSCCGGELGTLNPEDCIILNAELCPMHGYYFMVADSPGWCLGATLKV